MRREGLRQLEPRAARGEQVEELLLLGVVGTGGITERGPDPPVVLLDQLLVGQRFLRCVPLATHLRVQPLCECLGESVGEGLDHDRAVVVVLLLVAPSDLVGAVDPDPESADRVAGRREVVGQAAVRPRVAVVGLLAQEAEPCSLIQKNIVAVGARAPVAVHPAADQQAVTRDLAQQRLRVVIELASLRTLEDRGELPLQLPGVEEELPVDDIAQGQQVGLDEANALERRGGHVVERQPMAVRARVVE